MGALAGQLDIARAQLESPARGARKGQLWAAAAGAADEAALQLFEEHGPALVEHLHGPFALAAWDGATLLLARDAFGQRPLFYCEHEGSLWFGSHPQELKELGAPLGQIDRGALSDYLELLYVPAPASVWSGLRKLPAGHLLRAGEHGVEVRRWFELPAPGSGQKRPSRIAVRARLEQAVRAASGGDPCVLLDGQLPSSALLALLTRQHGRVRTFAIDGDAQARRLAERFRSAHTELSLNPLDELQQALAGAGEPLGDASLLQSAAALRAVSRECPAVLTGAGAAELFAGRRRYLRAQRLPHLKRTARAADLLRSIAPGRHKGRLQRAAGALGDTGAGRARALVEVFSLDERRALLGAQARVAEDATAATASAADAALAFDLEVALPDGTLSGLDAVRSGVELRAPFLDAQLARAVVPPPARAKLGRTHGNRLLRDAVADLLPRDVLTVEERPRPPVGAWLRGPLRTLLHDLVASPSARIRALLDPRGIDEVLRNSLAPRGDPRQAWALLALEVWVRANRR